MMAQGRRQSTAEYREEAVRLVLDSGRSIAPVARELGVNEGTLGNWVNRYRHEHAGDEPALEVNKRARLRELEKENRDLRGLFTRIVSRFHPACPHKRRSVSREDWVSRLNPKKRTVADAAYNRVHEG